MGAYLLIFPDKKYLNTKNLTDFGSMENSISINCVNTNVSYALSDVNGTVLSNVPTTQPTNPSGGDYWLDTTTTPHVLRRYSASSSSWVSVSTVYTKISASGIGVGFSQYDGVKISGITYSGESTATAKQYDELNGTKIIQAIDSSNNWIVIVGLIDVASTQSTGTVTVARTLPEMDYVTEANNRVWGCKYGIVNGKTLNEIYCCALGDFRNWNKFQGISTDSYIASCGTDGAFTGAVSHQGHPIFFKENVLHKVYVSTSGAHQIQPTECRGVQSGCHKSLSIVNEMLYYKSPAGICAYDGSLPVSVSANFGTDMYSNAVAGSLKGKYYVSMKDSSNNWHMFVYDTEKGIWHREDNMHAKCFTRLGEDLLLIDNDTNKLISVTGASGTAEASDVDWFVETGLIGYNTVEQKYISRFNLRMQIPRGTKADLYIEYDSDGIWHHSGHMQDIGTRTIMLPVRPRRCDHFRLRIEGMGDIRVYSMARILEIGSD